jgi:hypothetical protein
MCGPFLPHGHAYNSQPVGFTITHYWTRVLTNMSRSHNQMPDGPHIRPFILACRLRREICLPIHGARASAAESTTGDTWPTPVKHLSNQWRTPAGPARAGPRAGSDRASDVPRTCRATLETHPPAKLNSINNTRELAATYLRIILGIIIGIWPRFTAIISPQLICLKICRLEFVEVIVET